jgi:hypothetical protein
MSMLTAIKLLHTVIWAILAPIPVGRDPDRARVAGVRRAGRKSRHMPTVGLGPAVHHRPRLQLRHLRAELG